MSRLTTRMSIMGRKHDIEGGQAHHWKKLLKDYDYHLIENAIDKLGDLEDIEDELGIDLITLFKALKNGARFSEKDEKALGIPFVHKEYSPTLVYGFYTQKWRLRASGYERETKDFGKTWALAEEELEK